MKSSKTAPSTKPSESGPSKGGAAPSSDKSGSNAKPSSKRSAQQGEKKTTP